MRLVRPADSAAAILADGSEAPLDKRKVLQAWMPWAILTVFILCWGLPQTKTALDKIAAPKFAMWHLDQRVQRMPPVVPEGTKPEPAIFQFSYLSATGTGILAAAVIAGFAMGFTPGVMLIAYGRTIWRVRFSLLTNRRHARPRQRHQIRRHRRHPRPRPRP